MSANPADAKPTIVLVHGLWMTPRSWEHWIDRFESSGHEVLAPSWPGLEGTANRALFDVGLATFTRNGPTTVDFTRDDRAPMLSIAFENDHIVPPKAARHNVEKYKSKSITAFKEFPGRPHFPGAPGWEEVADHSIAWAMNPTAAESRPAAPAPA